MSHFFIREICLNPDDSKPLYLQLANSLSSQIKRGVLKPGFRLPGSRKLAELLNLNRNTILAALDELTAEGWLVAKKRKGFFVNEELPIPRYQHPDNNVIGTYPRQTPWPLARNLDWDLPVRRSLKYEFNDGLPDFRLAPVHEIRKEYTSLLNTGSLKSLLSYADPRGDEKLRMAIAKMLQEHRGLNPNPNQIMITRGSIMGLYMLSQVLVEKGDGFGMEWPGYRGAEDCFRTAGCKILHVPVDEKGLDVEQLKKEIEQKPIKALYVTSHHQHPTTVSLAPERRMELLHLAQSQSFAIIEDDYDYEFHYENKPLLPIASADNTGSVIYIGSFSKTLFPSLRIGWMVGPEELIETLAKLRFIIDNNGDTVMERALSRIISNGVYHRHIRKSLTCYRRRKELFCSILKKDFPQWITFNEPEGGMVIWGQFHKSISMEELIKQCLAKGLFLSGSHCHNLTGDELNATRLGFASMDEDEIESACFILGRVLTQN
jgi:GntR family transcriptional regulator / MocR family aminotransferase